MGGLVPWPEPWAEDRRGHRSRGRVLLTTYFATLVILASSGPGQETTPKAGVPAPASLQAGASASATLNFAMEIVGAR